MKTILLIFTLSCFASIAAADLISHWPFDGDFANVAGGEDGEEVGGVEFAPDRLGTPDGAISIDGESQQYVEVIEGGGMDDLQEGTIALWVKWTGPQDNACCGGSHGNVIARQSNGLFSNQVIGLDSPDPESARISWQAYNAGGPTLVGDTEVGDDTWRHVAITWSDGEHILYLDGEEDGTSDQVGAMRTQLEIPLTIGAWIGDGAGYSTAHIDDVRVFDTVLTPEEVQALTLPPTDIIVDNNQFLTIAAQGDDIGTLTTITGDEDDTFTYALIDGDGSDDNAKFQITGDKLQAGAFDFSGSDDMEAFSIRIKSTGAPSGDEFEAELTLVIRADSDSDGLLDSYERRFTEDLAVLSGLADADADEDGLTDLAEFELDQGDFPDIDPTKADTDEDGLKDGDEINPTAPQVKTNPINPDTDGDGLKDGVETNTGTFVDANDTGTDPTKSDSDGDTVADGVEVTKGSNPTDAASLPPVGLVGLWRFDEENANDSSEFGNDGTLTEGEYSDDVPDALGGGKSLALVEGAQYVEVPHDVSLDITEAMTIAVWVKTDGEVAWDGVLAKNPSDGSSPNHAGNYELRIENGSRQLHFLYQRGGANDTTFPIAQAGESIIEDGVWTHVAVTAQQGGDLNYYVNGELADTQSIEETFGATNENPLYLGSRADEFTGFDGNLDDVAIFDGVITEAQIEAILQGDFSDFGIGGSVPFSITDVVPGADGNVTITWISRPGRTYRVEASVDLENWIELTDGVESEGESTSFVDTFFATDKPDVYYRILLEQ